MTIKEWYEVVAFLNVMYEQNDKLMFDIQNPDKITVWYSMLQDLDFRVCFNAVKKYAATNKFRPTIADIREEYVKITNGADNLPEAEAWSLVRIALRDSSYHAEEQFAELPEIVRNALVTPDRLREWAQMPSDTVGTVVRAEFRRCFESAVKQNEEKQKLGAIGMVAQDIANKLTMKEE